MDLTLLHQPLDGVDAPLIVVALPEDPDLPGRIREPRDRHRWDHLLRQLDVSLNGLLAASLEGGAFRGQGDETLLLHAVGEGGTLRRFLLVGMGAPEQVDRTAIRNAAARGVRRAEALKCTVLHFRLLSPDSISPEGAAEAAAEGAVLAAWDFRELRSAPASPAAAPPPLVAAVSVAIELAQEAVALPDDGVLASAIRRGMIMAEGANLARTLQQRPGNVATPEHLAGVALDLADRHGLEVEILGPREMEAEAMGALLSVARGSDQEPRLIILRHRGHQGDDARPLVLVGKGLTFDSGGISIKPALGMEDMKFDMSGGAAVLGAMMAIARLDVASPVIGVVPASENLINGAATKPGDVIRTRAGKTVEVINTDAEGRLILADALHYAVERFNPSAVVDCATLTGACVIALGSHAAAVLGTDESLIQELREAGDLAGERCWPLPLWKPYAKQLDSPIADLKNVGGRPAGTITAAHFLSNFVKDAPWAHLDIAGTAYGEAREPWHRTGGYGFPTRLLIQWVLGRGAS
jgi:leucyl aminopeptidase